MTIVVKNLNYETTEEKLREVFSAVATVRSVTLAHKKNIKTGEFVSPRLSTFNIPRQEIGEEVAKYVANSIRSHQIALSQIVIRCDYIERESNIQIK